MTTIVVMVLMNIVIASFVIVCRKSSHAEIRNVFERIIFGMLICIFCNCL